MKISGLLMVAVQVLLPHRPTNCITRFEGLLYDVGTDESIRTSNLFRISNIIHRAR